MIHTAAYFSAAVTAGATDFDLPAVTEAPTPVQNNHFAFQVPAKVIGMYVLGVNLTRAKIQTPKLRALSNPYIQPIERSATVPNRALFADYTTGPLQLAPFDETSLLVSNDAGAGTTISGFIWVDDGNTVRPAGQIFTVRGTLSGTGAAGTWLLSSMTLDQTLPAGRYSVVGMKVISTLAAAARLVFPGQVWRPGVINSLTAGVYPGDYFQRGYLGELGQFESTAQPQIEVFGLGAAAPSEVYLDLIKIR